MSRKFSIKPRKPSQSPFLTSCTLKRRNHSNFPQQLPTATSKEVFIGTRTDVSLILTEVAPILQQLRFSVSLNIHIQICRGVHHRVTRESANSRAWTTLSKWTPRDARYVTFASLIGTVNLTFNFHFDQQTKASKSSESSLAKNLRPRHS
jgi:hypothetical protein